VVSDGSAVTIRWQYVDAETSRVVDSLAVLGEPERGSIAPVTIERLSLDRSCDGSAAAPVTPAGGSSLRYIRRNSSWVLNWKTQGDTVPDGDAGPGCYRVSIPRTDGVTDSVQVILQGALEAVSRRR
jgi:hypothetical protein